MNPMPGRCPVCDNALTVTRLHCGQCGTGIDGAFGLGRLQALNAEQVRFVEAFIKCRGKIKDVEDELDVSYPTVVARLNEVVRAMGYEVDESALSEVDKYEFFEAQVIQPRVPAPMQPSPRVPPAPPAPPAPPLPPIAPILPTSGSKLSPEKRQQILDDLSDGKLTLTEAMEKLQS